jgi:hypothetical protein
MKVYKLMDWIENEKHNVVFTYALLKFGPERMFENYLELARNFIDL